MLIIIINLDITGLCTSDFKQTVDYYHACRGRRRIFISPKAKAIYNINIISKHRGGFPEGQTPIVLDTLSNADYAKIAYTILIQDHVNEITFMQCCQVTK